MRSSDVVAYLQPNIGTTRIIHSVAAASSIHVAASNRRAAAKPAQGNSTALPVGVVAPIAGGSLSKAQNVFNLLKSNSYNPLAGYKGGGVYKNSNGLLPEGGDYYEHDVYSGQELEDMGASNRGLERIVYDSGSGEGWYTATHYGDAPQEGVEDFIKLVEEDGPEILEELPL